VRLGGVSLRSHRRDLLRANDDASQLAYSTCNSTSQKMQLRLRIAFRDYGVDSIQDSLVAPPGLEPGLSALKGPRVNQLHHGAKTRCCRRKGLVASTGIEPVLSALRGRRVNQLHHDARNQTGEELHPLAIDKLYQLTAPLSGPRDSEKEALTTRASSPHRCSTCGTGCPTPATLRR
jgi:hypothetical protein